MRLLEAAARQLALAAGGPHRDEMGAGQAAGKLGPPVSLQAHNPLRDEVVRFELDQRASGLPSHPEVDDGLEKVRLAHARGAVQEKEARRVGRLFGQGHPERQGPTHAGGRREAIEGQIGVGRHDVESMPSTSGPSSPLCETASDLCCPGRGAHFGPRTSGRLLARR